MADGDVVVAHLWRHIHMCQRILGGIERHLKIKEIDTDKQVQIGIAGERRRQTRIIVPRGSEGAYSAAAQIKNSVFACGEFEFPSQIFSIRGGKWPADFAHVE